MLIGATTLCDDGEGLFAKASGGASRRVIGIDSIGRGKPPASAARAYLGRRCAALPHFCVQIEELDVPWFLHGLRVAPRLPPMAPVMATGAFGPNGELS